MGQPMLLKNANELLAKILEKQGDFEGALSRYKLFKQFSDSINNTQGKRLATALESEYEFSKRTLEFEKAALRQQWLFYSSIVGLVTFLVIVFGLPKPKQPQQGLSKSERKKYRNRDQKHGSRKYPHATQIDATAPDPIRKDGLLGRADRRNRTRNPKPAQLC
jgi:hypothetical protein